MRLDKLLVSQGLCTRSEAGKIAKQGGIRVNGETVKSADIKVEPLTDVIFFCGKEIIYREYVYILMNKPSGVVSSTDGKDGETVINLLPPEIQKTGVFPCGRLDKDTVGVLLITNDGETSHKLLSPKKHVDKTYFVRTMSDLTDKDIKTLESGMDIGGGDKAMPAKVERASKNELYITIKEGMYHQIKRMIEKCGNKVIFLERVKFACLSLEDAPERGCWRYLTDKEIQMLKEYKTTD